MRILFHILLLSFPLLAIGQTDSTTNTVEYDTTNVQHTLANTESPNDSLIAVKKVIIVDTTKVGKVEEFLDEGKKETTKQLDELFSAGEIVLTVFALFGTYIFIRIVIFLLENFAERFPNYRLVLKGLIPVSRLVVWVLAIYVVIYGIIGPPAETIYAILASIGLAVGFASQDILKNVFGGIMLIIDRPFQVGDKIDIGGHYGEVLTIGLRSTRLVTPDDSVVAVPNGELMNQAVSNSNSSALDCQVVAEIFLPADTNVQEAKRIAWICAATSPYIYLKKPIVVIVAQKNEGRRPVLKMRIKAYVLDIRYEFAFMSDMTERTLTELKRRGFKLVGSDSPAQL